MKNEDDPAVQSFSTSGKAGPITVSFEETNGSTVVSLYEETSTQPDSSLDASNVVLTSQTDSSSDVEPTKIIIIGTAHVSEKSVREVQKTIEDEKPDVVAIELCPTRYKNITDPDAADKQVSFKEILKPGQIFYFLLYSFLSYIQKQMGEKMGVPPGSEMFAAMDAAKEVNAGLALIDRDIQVTFKRFIAKMSFFEKVKMLYSLVVGSLGFGDEVEVDINNMTDQTVVTALIEEFRKFSPTAASVLIDERDAYLAGSILKTIQVAGPGKKIVVVIGAGHKQGVVDYLQAPEKIPELSSLAYIPKKRFNFLKLIGYAITAVVLLSFAYIIYAIITYPEVTPDVLLLAFGCWFLINGTLSAAGVFLAGGRLKSAVTAFLVAWITSFNPMVAAGWFAGLVEAGIRKPTTKDMKNMISAETFKELKNNSFFKVIYVAALANVGSMIGTFIGAYAVLKISGVDIIGIVRTVITGLF
jgi:pheromone shutdown-related protein TraB